MVYIIAEASLNHNGNIATALTMIGMAKECGADCIKFQAYNTRSLASLTYQRDHYKQLDRCMLFRDDFKQIRRYCDIREIDFMCTPDDIESAEYLNELQGKFKVSSVGAANIHLLRLINKFKKPVFISNGLINHQGVALANKLLKDCRKVVWFDCVSDYPAKKEDYIDKICSGAEGLSDHTLGLDLAVDSAERGYKYIEKHFTLDKENCGFDHHMSIDPKELKELVRRVRACEK